MRILILVLSIIISAQLYCDEKTHELYVPYSDNTSYSHTDELYFHF